MVVHTCALVLETLPVVSLLADAVVLAGVCAAHAARHGVAAVGVRLAQRGAAGAILLDVAARGEVCGWGRQTGCSGVKLHHLLITQFTLSVGFTADC